ncbi:histone acetyltransferase KAT6A [Eupeodes corollae]|uniref:histone acetyltransferase KAT6A n=1 Tax=Eupeodes corollae TaxID=290404 RepID=UPI002490B246|nr:histone acetyltransferase KAT6A [Eupeodes corollae]
MKRGRKSDGPTTVRTTGRIKKAKVVFDPSDNNLPKHLRNSAGSVQSSQQQSQSDHASDTSNERRIKEEKPRIVNSNSLNNVFDETCCYVCGRRELKKNKNKLISCKDCDHKAHISCLRLDFEDHVKLRENYRCDVCQICSSCYEGPEDGELITCTKCVKSFHFACHIPSMARFPTQTKWLCSKCTIPKAKSLLKVLGVQAAPPPSAPPSSDVVDKKPAIPVETATVNNYTKETDKIIVKKQSSPSPNSRLSPNASSILQPSSNSLLTESNSQDLSDIPIVKNWSASQVTEYFTKFFPNEADIFKDQDIDGQSLLLLKRSDVVNRLAIKLGPALRIYNLVLKIQSVSTDPTIGW